MGSKCCPVLKVTEELPDKHSEEISYSSVKYSPRGPLLILIVEKIECEHFDFVLCSSSASFSFSSSSIFFFSITRNSESIQRILRIRNPNECATIRDLPFLVTAVCELRSTSYGPKHSLRWLIPIRNFVINYTNNSKTIGRIRTFYLSNDCCTI